LGEGKRSKSFRIIEFKDRRKIEVLTSTFNKNIFVQSAMMNKSLVVESPYTQKKGKPDKESPVTGMDALSME
jgi:hypothetical protein